MKIADPTLVTGKVEVFISLQISVSGTPSLGVFGGTGISLDPLSWISKCPGNKT